MTCLGVSVGRKRGAFPPHRRVRCLVKTEGIRSNILGTFNVMDSLQIDQIQRWTLDALISFLPRLRKLSDDGNHETLVAR